MPRKVAEQIAAENRFAQMAMPPSPPDDLKSEAARQLWRDITREFPATHFDVASQQLLWLFCRTTVYAKSLHADIEGLQPGKPEHSLVHKAIISANTSAASLAQKLRLTIQSVTDVHSRKLKDRVRGPRPWEPQGRLLGGNAVRGEPQ